MEEIFAPVDMVVYPIIYRVYINETWERDILK